MFTLAGATVQVVTAGLAPINATVVSTSPIGSTDALGDAPGFTVNYQITPPGLLDGLITAPTACYARRYADHRPHWQRRHDRDLGHVHGVGQREY